jgi:hypothetical protein
METRQTRSALFVDSRYFENHREAHAAYAAKAAMMTMMPSKLAHQLEL